MGRASLALLALLAACGRTPLVDVGVADEGTAGGGVSRGRAPVRGRGGLLGGGRAPPPDRAARLGRRGIAAPDLGRGPGLPVRALGRPAVHGRYGPRDGRGVRRVDPGGARSVT